MSRWFIIAGTVLFLIGIILHFFPGAFSWFGRLPGDIRIESPGSRVYIPFTTMILVSIILSIIIRLFRG